MDHRLGSSRRRRLVRLGGPLVVVAAAGSGVVVLTGARSGTEGAISIAASPGPTLTSTATPITSTEPLTATTPAIDVTSTAATTSTTSTTVATTPPAPTTTLFATQTLPATPDGPVSPPADARGFEPEVQLGGIEIPKLEVSEPLYEGIRLTTLDKGPGHWPGSALPGQDGNVVVAAHRTSHGGPFRHIDQLVEGDEVVFHTADGVLPYRVTSTMIVGPDALWITDPTDQATATLFACHPPGSVAQRIVVRLALAE